MPTTAFSNDAPNGRLFFDPDGAGGTGITQFAYVGASLALTNNDFFVV